MSHAPTFPDGRPRRGVHPDLYIDHAWLAQRDEEVLDPARPIVDPHHHLWQRANRYLVPELIDDLACGHAIRGTVYIECGSMYRADGDPRFQTVGEVEFANGVAAEFASGLHGPVRACAGIVGKVDLRLGAFAEDVLRACMERAPDRFRGIRHMAALDPSPDVSALLRPPPPDLLLDPSFREGFAKLAPLGLSYDSWCYHPQLPQLLDLIDAHPDTRVIVDHIGGRIGEGPYAPRRDDVFREWSASMKALARRPNVFVKIGGMNGRLNGFDFLDRDLPPSSQELAAAWRPYFDVCIDAFGPSRAMFESNFPPDKCGCTARVLWNAFKRLGAGFSESEKADLFAGTAIRAYRLPEALGRPA